jgi:hypothetical protein
MKIVLRIFGRAGERIEVNGPSVDSDAAPSAGAPAAGLYSELDGVGIGLFAHDGRLYLLLDGEVLAADGGLATDHAANGPRARLVLQDARGSRVIEYTRGAPVSTVFYSEDDEDADFGLWIHNVLASEARKRIFLSHWPQTGS